MNDNFNEQRAQADEEMVRKATKADRTGNLFFGVNQTGAFYGTDSQGPLGKFNFSTDASVWDDNGYGGLCHKTLGEWLTGIVTDANSKVDAILRAYEDTPDMTPDDVSKRIIEVMKSVYSAADVLWVEGDLHDNSRGEVFVSLDPRAAQSRGISIATLDAPRTVRDAKDAAVSLATHAATVVAARANELLQSIREKDAIEHADEYEEMLHEFRKESVKDQLKDEILAIEDRQQRMDAIHRYSRVFTR